MNQKGCTLEATAAGVFDLTIFENGIPVKIVRSIRLKKALQIMEEELGGRKE